jgi:cytochrome c5
MRHFALVGIFGLFAGLAGAQGLPDNDGRATYETVCGACHGADSVIGMSQTKEGWTDLVQAMRDRGATGSEDDFKKIVEYLTRNFPAKPAPAKPGAPTPAPSK